ncbi:carbohydrate deacetylase [Culicoidibacter larvae]|uniref:Carbohydrate deacetylase n=1 Tax=Culicoidibacter larvae TaxID=2579976 RepID=A0A5R8QJP1_9FIRM|nr:carbohydrate deacetylase [Culicoidibacter larvae]TLG77477.1 carbohydrate deacetylase [Culicoidibacter larvae]
MNVKKLIINADDFGYTPAVTQGIIEAHKNGVVTSTTALTVSEFFLPAMEIATICAPTLPIGVHLTLTLNKGKPILPLHLISSLVDEEGCFWNQNTFVDKVNIDEVYLEWDAQIVQFFKSGKRPDHIDSHHNVHGKNEQLFRVAAKLADKYNLPLRNPSRSPETAFLNDLDLPVRTPDKILPQFYGAGATFENLEVILDGIAASNDELFEINAHPAFVDHHLLAVSSYAYERVHELDILTSPEAKAAIEKREIVLTNYEVLK